MRRPAGRLDATFAEIVIGVAPSAGPEGGSAETVMMLAGLTAVKSMEKSDDTSNAVTRTRAVPTVFSL